MMHTFHLKPHGIVNPQPARADEFGSSCFTDSDVLPRGCSPEDPGIGEVPYELPEQHSCVCLDISYVLRRICSESYMSKLCYISYVSKLYIPRKLCKNRTRQSCINYVSLLKLYTCTICKLGKVAPLGKVVHISYAMCFCLENYVSKLKIRIFPKNLKVLRAKSLGEEGVNRPELKKSLGTAR